MTRANRWTTFVCAALLGTACRQREAPEPTKPRASAAAKPPASSAPGATPRAETPAAGPQRPLNVILLVIDSFRSDMPWNGYPRPIAPWLTRYEKTTVSYSRAYSISSSTARSMAPLLAGKYPSEMIRNGYFFTHWYPENVFIGERLQALGQRTIAAHAHAYFFASTGMNQGFDVHRVLEGTFLNNTSEDNITGERLANLAIEELSKTKNRPKDKRFFLYVHFMDPHAPYLEHEDQTSYGHQPRDRYDQEIEYTDAQVGKFVDWVKRQDFGEETAIILTGDHGESFGEHGHLKHGYELWEELVHVPLMIDVPGAKPRRIGVPRSHIDLAPTILELMGAAEAATLRGKSLVPELFGKQPEGRSVVMDLPRDNLQDRRRAIVEGNYKLIVSGDDRKWLMFDVEADPKERHNLTETERPRFKQLKARYLELSKTIGLEEIRGEPVQLRDAPAGRRW